MLGMCLGKELKSVDVSTRLGLHSFFFVLVSSFFFFLILTSFLLYLRVTKDSAIL